MLLPQWNVSVLYGTGNWMFYCIFISLICEVKFIYIHIYVYIYVRKILHGIDIYIL